MLKVGLTGGIACGKTLVREELEKLGACTLDADRLAREALGPGRPAYRSVVETFGEGCLRADGTIDRAALGELVFSDESARRKLNSIVHPEVLAEQDRQLEAIQALDDPRSPIVVVDAALMIEVGSHRRYDVILVVSCREDIRLQRLMARDGFTEAEARRRIDAQMPLAEKIACADHVIDNSGTREETRAQVAAIFRHLVSRCEQVRPSPERP